MKPKKASDGEEKVQTGSIKPTTLDSLDQRSATGVCVCVCLRVCLIVE